MTWDTHNESETEEAAAEVAAALSVRENQPIALVGGLGMGKTRFTKGLVRALGHQGDVTSPTFGLVHEYLQGTTPVFHFDFYRLENLEDALHIGWEDYLDEPGVVIVEWADRFPTLLPDSTRWFYFTVGDDPQSRSIKEGAPPK